MRFDDLTLTHTQTRITRASDYGVWGDVLRQQVADEFKYRYGYQGQFAEKDEETGWNHFELREFDPVIARWTTMDPYNEFFSPYVGMGNDPVSNVDPDGRRIIINRFLRRDLVYENGSLYNMDGSSYTGKVGGFSEKCFDALNNLNAVSDGASRLRTLESSPFDFVIKRGTNGFIPDSWANGEYFNNPAAATAIGTGGVIRWSPGNNSGDVNSMGNKTRPSFIALGHELLGHAWAAATGNGNYNTFVGLSGQRISSDEFNAVNVENLLRAQWGLPLRTHYGSESMIRSSGPFGFYKHGIRSNECYNCTPFQRFYTGRNSGR